MAVVSPKITATENIPLNFIDQINESEYRRGRERQRLGYYHGDDFPKLETTLERKVAWRERE